MEVVKRIFVPESELEQIVAGKQTARIILRPLHIARGPLILTSGLRAVEVDVEFCLPMRVGTLTRLHFNRAGYTDGNEFSKTWARICDEQRSPLQDREVTLVSFRAVART